MKTWFRRINGKTTDIDLVPKGNVGNLIAFGAKYFFQKSSCNIKNPFGRKVPEFGMFIIGFVTPNIYWIGGTDVVEFRIFRWVHNEASLTYTNWQTGEPNNFGGLEHCLQMSNGHTWNDNRCDRLNNFICETR